jgi:hypothetical protein
MCSLSVGFLDNAKYRTVGTFRWSEGGMSQGKNWLVMRRTVRDVMRG